VNILIRDLIEAACDELQHDTDVLEGKQDYEIAQRQALVQAFRKVLRKHRVMRIETKGTP